MFGRILSTPMYPTVCIYNCYLACTVVLGSASSIFRHIQALFESILTHIQNLATNSEPWHIQTARCIHNTILNIFGKAPSWTFDTVLNRLFYRCYLTSRITLWYLYVMFQTYSGISKTYSAIFGFVNAY